MMSLLGVSGKGFGRPAWGCSITLSIKSIIKFRFGGAGPDFEVVELQPDILVQS